MAWDGGASYFKWHWHPGYLKCLRFFVKTLLCLLFKYFFSLFIRNLCHFNLGLVPNISFELAIFSYLLQYFVKFSRGDISILYCLWNDISYAIWLGLGKQLNSIVFFFLYIEGFERLSCVGSCKRKKQASSTQCNTNRLSKHHWEML